MVERLTSNTHDKVDGVVPFDGPRLYKDSQAVLSMQKQPEEIPTTTSPTETESRGVFYEGILDSRRFPEPERSGTGRTIDVETVDNWTISMCDTPITLRGHRLYVFNALMSTREALTAADLCAFGFDPCARRSDFVRALNSLNNAMKRVIGFEPIAKVKVGRRNRFVMNPNVTVSNDKRSEASKTPLRGSVPQSHAQIPRQRNAKVAVGPSTSETKIPKNERETQRRERLLSEILRKYGSRVERRVHAKMRHPKPMRPNLTEVQRYYEYASQFDFLTAVEEVRLFQDIDTGYVTFLAMTDEERAKPNEAQLQALHNCTVAHRVIQGSNLKLVGSLARHPAWRNALPLGDLLSEGNLGLNKAIARFDFKLGYKFSTYAVAWIRQSIQRAIADKARLIRLPVDAHDAVLKMNRIEHDLLQQLGRPATEDEIIKESGLTKSNVRLYRQVGALQLASLDWEIDDGGTTLNEFVGDKHTDGGIAVNIMSDNSDVMKLFASRSLTDREKLVIGLRFGVFDRLPDLKEVEVDGRKVNIDHTTLLSDEGLTLDAISKMLNVTRERVRQIEKKGLSKARTVLLSSSP